MPWVNKPFWQHFGSGRCLSAHLFVIINVIAAKTARLWVINVTRLLRLWQTQIYDKWTENDAFLADSLHSPKMLLHLPVRLSKQSHLEESKRESRSISASTVAVETWELPSSPHYWPHTSRVESYPVIGVTEHAAAALATPTCWCVCDLRQSN